MTDSLSNLQTTSLQGRTVLLVDDDSNNIFATEMLLEKKGITVITAENGQEAMSKLEDEGNHIELVLMDVMMPVMDGLTATRLLRNNSRFATLPIITLTAKNMKSDRDECMDAGASDYLAKPVAATSLYKMLESWFWFIDKK